MLYSPPSRRLLSASGSRPPSPCQVATPRQQLSKEIKSQLAEYASHKQPAVALQQFAYECVLTLLDNARIDTSHSPAPSEVQHILRRWDAIRATVHTSLESGYTIIEEADDHNQLYSKAGAMGTTSDTEMDAPQGALAVAIGADALVQVALVEGSDADILDDVAIASNTVTAFNTTPSYENFEAHEQHTSSNPDAVDHSVDTDLGSANDGGSRRSREQLNVHLPHTRETDTWRETHRKQESPVRHTKDQKSINKRKCSLSSPKASPGKRGRYSTRITPFVPRRLGTSYTLEECITTRNTFIIWLKEKSQLISEEVKEGLDILIFQDVLGGTLENLLSNVTGWIELQEVPQIKTMTRRSDAYARAPLGVQSILQKVWWYEEQIKKASLHNLRHYVMLYESDKDFTLMIDQINQSPPESDLATWVEGEVGERPHKTKAKTWLFDALAKAAGLPRANNPAGNTPIRSHMRKCRAVGQFCDVMGGPGVLALKINATRSKHEIYNVLTDRVPKAVFAEVASHLEGKLDPIHKLSRILEAHLIKPLQACNWQSTGSTHTLQPFLIELQMAGFDEIVTAIQQHKWDDLFAGERDTALSVGSEHLVNSSHQKHPEMGVGVLHCKMGLVIKEQVERQDASRPRN